MKKSVLVVAFVVGGLVYHGFKNVNSVDSKDDEILNESIGDSMKSQNSVRMTATKINGESKTVEEVVGEIESLSSNGVGSDDNTADYNPEEFLASLTDAEFKDVSSLPEVFNSLALNATSIDDLAKTLYEKGYTPTKQKRGHPKTGFRHVLTIGESTSDVGLVREFYSSYLESDGKIYFDRLYYGMINKEGMFEHLSNSLEEKLKDVALNKTVKPGYVRWDLEGGKFVFINKDYQLGDENIVLVGQEFEIH